MSKKALIVWGGWDGHEPDLVAKRFEKMLIGEGFEVKVSDTLDAFNDVDELKALDLIVPIWTSGTIQSEQSANVMEAVASGVGIAGCHGGMCDAFRNDVGWQFMTGSQWVSHPGGDGVEYKVNIAKSSSSELIQGIDDFMVKSEQYYIHIDPAVNVLATTRYPVTGYYHSTNGEVDVPVTYTKLWGYGRVFYTSIGHHADIFDIPQASDMMLRGMLWCAQGKEIAKAHGKDYRLLDSKAKMY